MRLFIAEKPSLGKTVAQGLGGGKPGTGCISGEGWAVTWCFGHLFEQAEPDAYLPDDVPTGKNGRKRWRMEGLPILPEQWWRAAKPDAKKQLKVIAGLLKHASEVVNCGDPDREGQLLVDEVLEELGWRGRTLRAWLPDLSDAGIRKSLARLHPQGARWRPWRGRFGWPRANPDPGPGGSTRSRH